MVTIGHEGHEELDCWDTHPYKLHDTLYDLYGLHDINIAIYNRSMHIYIYGQYSLCMTFSINKT